MMRICTRADSICLNYESLPGALLYYPYLSYFASSLNVILKSVFNEMSAAYSVQANSHTARQTNAASSLSLVSSRHSRTVRRLQRLPGLGGRGGGCHFRASLPFLQLSSPAHENRRPSWCNPSPRSRRDVGNAQRLHLQVGWWVQKREWQIAFYCDEAWMPTRNLDDRLSSFVHRSRLERSGSPGHHLLDSNSLLCHVLSAQDF